MKARTTEQRSRLPNHNSAATPDTSCHRLDRARLSLSYHDGDENDDDDDNDDDNNDYKASGIMMKDRAWLSPVSASTGQLTFPPFYILR